MWWGVSSPPAERVGEDARRAGEGGKRRVGMTKKIICDTTTFQWFKNRSRRLRRGPTEAERLLWALLRSRRLAEHKFRRQVVLGPFIVDFCCFEKRLIVELDGGQHASQTEKDDSRTEELNNRGFRVLRFWDDDVMKNTETVLKVAWNALNNEPPSPALRASSPTRSAGGEEIPRKLCPTR
jgi:very-short-patch-repair endonuclease